MFNFSIDEKNAELVNLASDSRYLTRSTQVLELRAEASELLGAPKILARLENRQDDQPILLIFRPNLRELPISQPVRGENKSNLKTDESQIQ